MGSWRPVIDRILAQRLVDENDCWIWQGKSKNKGYGVIRIGGRRGVTAFVHRVLYEAAKGPIPDGLVIDHLCRNPACVNPDHLQAVTQAVNVQRGESPFARNARKTHCPQGHELIAPNLYSKRGLRECLACRRVRGRKKRAPATG